MAKKRALRGVWIALCRTAAPPVSTHPLAELGPDAPAASEAPHVAPKREQLIGLLELAEQHRQAFRELQAVRRHIDSRPVRQLIDEMKAEHRFDAADQALRVALSAYPGARKA